MNVSVLGPLEASVGGRQVALGAGKPRALLAILALHAGEPVSTERLIEGLWGEQPPASATKLVQLYVSQLRKALTAAGDGAAIVTRGHGYELQLAPEEIDAAVFERLVAEGAPREALSLWRGSPLDDVAGEPFAPAEIRRLEELRLAALEQAIDADLAAGRHGEVLAELEALVAQEPLCERLQAQRMLALYRSGRQADALAAYREARRALVEQVGLEPGPELRHLQEAVLAQDASLETPGTLAQWVRVDAERRLDTAVGRAASERAELRAAEAEVAGGVEELQAARTAGARVVACPFKGLASFDVDDAEVFFGRERLVAEMVARLAGAPFMAVVGPSGSGKSSALRAGLLAALAAGVLPGSDRWEIVLLRPGEHPMRALEQATANLAGRSVLAVDQFEELFTACRDESERGDFATALAQRAGAPGRTPVLIAVRADFYGRIAAFPELARLVGANQVLVGPMRRDELRRTIELPAQRAGLVVEPDLADALVADVLGEPGALPLLSSSLLELWQRRDGHSLRFAAYDQAGGVRGAVARLAERAYERLDPEHRDVARRILLRLSEGEGEAVVRRRVPLAELEGDGVEETLAVLADERLVTIGEGEVEVAHEALLREWPRLRGWLEEDAEGRRVYGHLIGATRDWHAGGRDPGELYRGARLAAALDWAAGRSAVLNETERAFLDSSRVAAEQEAGRQRRANRRLRVLLGSLAVLLAVAVAAGVAAISQRGEARDAAQAADAQRLGSQALTEERLDRALLLARTGVALDDSLATQSNLLAVLQRSPAALHVIRGSGPPLITVAVSPDGRRIVTGDQDGLVSFLDARTHRPLARYRLRAGLVQELSFSPDGRILAVAGHEPQNEPPGALVDLLDARTARRIRRVVMPHFPDPSLWIVLGLVWLPDGDLVVQQMHNDFPNGPPSVLWRMNPRTGGLRRAPERIGRAATMALGATRDGRLFASNARDDATFEIDADTLAVVKRHEGGDESGAVSPDGRLFALGSASGRVRLLDLRTDRIRRLDGRHDGPVNTMRFTPDGRTLVTTGNDGRVIVWDVAAGGIRETFSGHRTGQTWGLAITADGRTLYSASLDGRAIEWDLAGDRRLGRPFAAARPYDIEDQYPVGLAFAGDGRTLAMTEIDGSITFLDTRTLAKRRGPRAIDGMAAGIAYNRDGRLLAVSGERGQVRLLDTRTGRVVAELHGLRQLTQEVEFSPDGRLLAAGENSGDKGPGVMVWDVRRRAPTRVRFGVGSASVSFSPDGHWLAAAVVDRGAHVRDARTGRLVARLQLPDRVRSVAFSPAGGLLAVGTYDGKLQLFSTDGFKPTGPPIELHTGRIPSIDFSRDGRLMATASEDGTATLFDVGARKQIGGPITVDPNAYVSAALTPDGAYLFAVSTGGRGLRWDVSPAAWNARACAVAGRDMTAAEWRETLPNRNQQAVCR